MRVKCVLCDTIDVIDDHCLLAKKLRNRPIHTYMCPSCRERIAEKTQHRVDTGNFILYRNPDKENDW